MPGKTATATAAPCHAGSSSSQVTEAGELRPASYAPYLDLRPATDAELPAIGALVKTMGWLHSDVENRALDYGIDVLSAEHLAEVRSRTLRTRRQGEGRRPGAPHPRGHLLGPPGERASAAGRCRQGHRA